MNVKLTEEQKAAAARCVELLKQAEKEARATGLFIVTVSVTKCTKAVEYAVKKATS